MLILAAEQEIKPYTLCVIVDMPLD